MIKRIGLLAIAGMVVVCIVIVYHNRPQTVHFDAILLKSPVAGSSCANAINRQGHIVGYWDEEEPSKTQAVLWTDPNTVVQLNSFGTASMAHDINNQDAVVGWVETAEGKTHAFLWTEKKGMVDLGTLGGERSWAQGISNAGSVVGTSWTAAKQSHAFVWEESVGMTDLGTLGGTVSSASDINDSGQIVGDSAPGPKSSYHAYLWDRQRGMVDLGTLGGQWSSAVSINNPGQILGMAEDASGRVHFCVWDSQGRIRDMGILRGHDTEPRKINDLGQFVGNQQIESYLLGYSGMKAFSADSEGRFFRPVLHGISSKGEIACSFHGINHDGWVVGSMSLNKQQSWNAILVKPKTRGVGIEAPAKRTQHDD